MFVWYIQDMHYTELSQEFTNKFFELITQANRIIICGHMYPDEDAVSSTLAVYEIIQQKAPGKKVRMIISSEPTDRYKSFKNFDKLEFVPDVADVVQPSDTLIMVDGSQLYRFSRQPEKLATVKTRICIDHHASPVEDFTLSMVVPTAPAAAEVVYRSLAGNVSMSKELAEIFLLGIFGDTGTLAYIKPNQLETLPLVKDLLGIADVEVQEFIARYDTISQREFTVFKEFCKNTMFGKADGWPNFQYAFLTSDFVKQSAYTNSELTHGSEIYKDTFLRKVSDYPWGFMLKPTPEGRVSISCRSLPGSVNVRDVMERMQLGGGHNRAAGGEVASNDEQKVLAQVLDWISNNKPELI